jgi:hypothetical protein
MAEMTMRDLIFKHRKAQHYWANPFLDTFGVPLDKYMDGVMGFDICRFDSEVLGAPAYEDNQTSMQDYIRRKYGEDAVIMIQALIA